jgi:hypothetical protein
MYPSNSPFVLFGGLHAFWNSLSGWVAPFGARWADRMKDAILDLGTNSDEEASESIEPLPLPPLDKERFLVEMHVRVENALRQVADRLNEASGGFIAAEIANEVEAIFAELAREAAEEAFRLRMGAAESDLPLKVAGSDWARKYRRMMAEEGRWPTRPETPSSAG